MTEEYYEARQFWPRGWSAVIYSTTVRTATFRPIVGFEDRPWPRPQRVELQQAVIERRSTSYEGNANTVRSTMV
jgi:hypothetical protein